MTGTIQPGELLGILGGGQLGRMFAIAARRMGYRVRVFTDQAGSPAAQLADESVVVDFHDPTSIDGMLNDVRVLTYETENLPFEFVQHAANQTLVRPSLGLLKISQDRWLEKTSLSELGLPVAPYLPIRREAELEPGLGEFDGRAVLKTTFGGYDGKGQWMLRSADESHNRTLASAKEAVQANAVDDGDRPRFILESFVEFESEFSMLAARAADGRVETYGPILNHHRDHILDVSRYPTQLGESVGNEAQRMIREVAERFEVVGIFCIEFFLGRDATVLINEIAPRTHNSGHLTIEASPTSQFAQQVRAIAGLSLGTTANPRPAAMANLLGDIWLGGTPPAWDRALAVPGVSLHLYGKAEARSKRKMGHLTAVADSTDEAERRARLARELLDPAKQLERA